MKTLTAWVRAARPGPAEGPDTAGSPPGSPPAGAGGTAAPAEAGSATGWLRDNRVTLIAGALIAIQLLWMAALLSRSYFRQDDFYNFDRALAEGFTWKYLMLVSAGHMAPLGFAVSWVLAHAALYDWTLTALVILVLVLAACLALMRMLRTLFGNRPAILIPLMVYLFSPLALAAVDWWSVAVQTLPLEIAIFMAVDAHVRYLREGRIRQLAAAAGWLLLGMATVQKGAVVPVLLFGLTSAFFTEGGWLSGIVQAARRYWRAWAVYGLMLAAYLVLFLSVLPTSTTPPTGPGPAERVLTFVTTLTGTTLVPGAVGGPWHWSVLGDGNAQASSPAALQQLSWALAVLVIAVSIAFRPRAARAWAILAGWILAADVLPVVIGRLGSADPRVLGLQARYVTDVAAVLALCLALAFLPLAGQEGGYRFAGPALAPGRPGRIATARRAGRVPGRLVLVAPVADRPHRHPRVPVLYRHRPRRGDQGAARHAGRGRAHPARGHGPAAVPGQREHVPGGRRAGPRPARGPADLAQPPAGPGARADDVQHAGPAPARRAARPVDGSPPSGAAAGRCAWARRSASRCPGRCTGGRGRWAWTTTGRPPRSTSGSAASGRTPRCPRDGTTTTSR